MSAKPTVEEIRWAVTAGGVESVNQSPTDATQKDGGYADDEIPTAKQWNYLFRRHYAWARYLSDGILTGGLTVDSLAVSGSTTLSGLAAMRGELQLAAPLAFTPFVFTSVNGIFGFAVTKIAHGLNTGDGPLLFSNVGGALPPGLISPGWPIKVDADHFLVAPSLGRALAKQEQPITGAGSGVHTASPASDALLGSGTHSAGITPDVALGNTSSLAQVVGGITADGPLCGTDVYCTAAQTLTLPPGSGVVSSSSPPATYSTTTKKWTFAAAGSIEFPLDLRQGDAILGFKVYYHKGSNAATTLTFALTSLAVPGSPAAALLGAGVGFLVSTTDATNAPGDTSTSSGLIRSAGSILEGGSMSLDISSSSGSALDQVFMVQIFVRRPPP